MTLECCLTSDYAANNYTVTNQLLQDKNPLEEVCLVVDFQGNYRLKQPPRSIIRELGWCDWRAENCRSFLYLPLESYGKLSDDDRRTHGGKDHRTPFLHPPSRKCQIAYRVQWKLISLPVPKTRKRFEKTGGLQGLSFGNTPFGWVTDSTCDHMPRLRSVSSCGHHSPKVECYHFVQWMRRMIDGTCT